MSDAPVFLAEATQNVPTAISGLSGLTINDIVPLAGGYFVVVLGPPNGMHVLYLELWQVQSGVPTYLSTTTTPTMYPVNGDATAGVFCQDVTPLSDGTRFAMIVTAGSGGSTSHYAVAAQRSGSSLSVGTPLLVLNLDSASWDFYPQVEAGVMETDVTWAAQGPATTITAVDSNRVVVTVGMQRFYSSVVENRLAAVSLDLSSTTVTRSQQWVTGHVVNNSQPNYDWYLNSAALYGSHLAVLAHTDDWSSWILPVDVSSSTLSFPSRFSVGVAYPYYASSYNVALSNDRMGVGIYDGGMPAGWNGFGWSFPASADGSANIVEAVSYTTGNGSGFRTTDKINYATPSDGLFVWGNPSGVAVAELRFPAGGTPYLTDYCEYTPIASSNITSSALVEVLPGTSYGLLVSTSYPRTTYTTLLWQFTSTVPVVAVLPAALRMRQRDDGAGLDSGHARLNVADMVPNQSTSYQTSRAPRLGEKGYS